MAVIAVILPDPLGTHQPFMAKSFYAHRFTLPKMCLRHSCPAASCPNRSIVTSAAGLRQGYIRITTINMICRSIINMTGHDMPFMTICTIGCGQSRFMIKHNITIIVIGTAVMTTGTVEVIGRICPAGHETVIVRS